MNGDQHSSNNIILRDVGFVYSVFRLMHDMLIIFWLGTVLETFRGVGCWPGREWAQSLGKLVLPWIPCQSTDRGVIFFFAYAASIELN